MKGLLSILATLQGKMLAGVVATSLLVGGGLVAYNVGNGSSLSGRAHGAGSSVQANGRADRAISGQQGAAVSGAGVSGEGEANAHKSSSGGVSGGAGTGLRAGSRPLAGTNPSLLGLIPSVQVDGETGSGSSGSDGSNPSGGGSGGNNPSGGGGSARLPGAPNIPAAPQPGTPVLAPPSGASIYSEGSMSVYVPAVAGQTWTLCLSAAGEVKGERCVDAGVRETKPVKLTISYSGNASATAPTLTPGSCKGQSGQSISVSGLAPGASVTAIAGERTVSKDLESKGQTFTASFCQKS